MASGQDQSPQRDPSEAKNQPQPEPADGQEPGLFENLNDFMPLDETAGEPAGSVEPTESLEPIEATENFEPLEPLSESTEALAQTPGEPTEPDLAGEEVTGAEPEQPGLAETVAFQASDSQVAEALEAPSGETPEGQPLSESELAAAAPSDGIEPLPVGGLLGAGLLGAETATAEPGAEAEATLAEEEANEEEEEKGGGILAWIGETSVYNVLLFVAMVALILGSLGLYLELKRYNFDIKAREGKQPIAAARAHYAEPMTTAVA